MNQLKYITHLLLNSKYKFLINIFLITIIYIGFYGQNLTLCMIEEKIPEIAEAKPIIQSQATLTNLEQLIHRNIDAYIGNKVLIEEQNQEILAFKKEIAFLHERDYFIFSDDYVADEIANRGIEDKINKLCIKYGRPLEYPPIDENIDKEI